MSVPSWNQAAMAVDAISETFPEAPKGVEETASAALTARAIVAVTFTGAGFWYLLWKLALVFVAGR